jgi:hypothetical protein
MSAVTLSHSPRLLSRVVAGLLSLLAPGVGHLYAGTDAARLIRAAPP